MLRRERRVAGGLKSVGRYGTMVSMLMKKRPVLYCLFRRLFWACMVRMRDSCSVGWVSYVFFVFIEGKDEAVSEVGELPCSSMASGRESSESLSVGNWKVFRNLAVVVSILSNL